jgi:RNA-binding protein
MPPPSNPKKRALMPSTKLRKALRAAGHHLAAIVQVGKEGLTEPVLRQLDEALRAHELVKVKVGTESPADRFEVAGRLAADSDAHVAQVLGRTVLVYRKHPERPRFEAVDPVAAAAARSSRERDAKPSRRRSGPRGRPARRSGPGPKRSGPRSGSGAKPRPGPKSGPRSRPAPGARAPRR